MANNKDFIVKGDIEATNIIEGLGTTTAGSFGFSLADGSYDSKSFSVASQETNPQGVFFKTDGTKMYVVGTAGGAVFQYGLTTAFDVSTASYDSVSLTDFNVVGTSRNGSSLFFHPDGTYIFIVDQTNQTNLVRLTLSTPWDLTTAGSKVTNSSLPSGKASNAAQAIFFKPDGSKMYLCENANSSTDVHGFNLSTNWDISSSSISNDSSFETTAQDNEIEGLFLNTDGTEFYLVGYQNDKVYRYTMSTPYDISTSTFVDDFSVASQETQSQALTFKPDGTKMYVVGAANDTVYQYSTTGATTALDLSTGSVFNFTPTSNTQVTLTNSAPSGTVSQATLVYNSEDAAGIADKFSVDTYTGNNTTNQITNGLNLSGDGGLVWLKCRSNTGSNMVFDTNRGRAVNLQPSGTDPEDTFSATTGLTSFNTDGFTLGANNYGSTNNDGRTFVSWSWKKAAGFFDIITYTGTQDGDKTLSHNLGSAPGMVVIRNKANGNDWYVYHRSRGTGKYLYVNLTNAEASGTIVTAATSSSITVSQSNGFNSNGANYLVYLFGHNTSTISCGNYTGNGSNSGSKTVDVGFEPQFVMIKRYDDTGAWIVLDTARGMEANGTSNDAILNWNSTATEASLAQSAMEATSTGFALRSAGAGFNGNGGTYIYMAIAAESATTTTYNNTIDWPGGTAPTSPAIGETDVLTFSTSDGGATYKAVHAIDGAK